MSNHILNCWKRILVVSQIVIFLNGMTFAEGVIFHKPPRSARGYEPLMLEAVVESPDARIISVSIMHRSAGQEGYAEESMTAGGTGLFFGSIPAVHVSDPGLEYYLVAVLSDNSIIAYPSDQPEIRPVFVAVTPGDPEVGELFEEFQSETGEQFEALILSPEPGIVLLPENVLIAVSLFNVPDVNIGTVRVLLDGKDITAKSAVSADLITYSPPPKQLPSGKHVVEIHLSTNSGEAYNPLRWEFRTTLKASERTAARYQHSGQVTSAFKRDDIDKQVLEVGRIDATYRGGWDWLKIKGKLKLTTEEDALKQPRNRLGVTFSTSYFSLGLGDVTPRLNRFAMDGKRVRGIDANLTLGVFSLRVAQGELERAIQGAEGEAYSVAGFDQLSDSLGNLTYALDLSRSDYTFKRDVLAVRSAFGSGKHVQLGLSFVKAKDKPETVRQVISDGIVDIPTELISHPAFQNEGWFNDTTKTEYPITYQRLLAVATPDLFITLPEEDWSGRTPQDNLVLGGDLSLSFDRQRVTIQSGMALSMLNKNIWDPVLTKAGLDTLFPGDDTIDGFVGGEDGIKLEDIPIDPKDYENIFYMNANQIPLLPVDPEDLSFSALTKLPSLAYFMTAKFNYLKNYITIEFRQVGPEFNSLANPFLQKNIRKRSISDRIRMFSNKFFITGLYETTDDDITGEAEKITKTQTFNLSFSLMPGAGLPSLSFGSRYYTRNNGIDVITILASDDSLYEVTGDPNDIVILEYEDRREKTQTNTQNIGVTYQVNALGTTHDLSINVVNTVKEDLFTDRIDPNFISPAATSKLLSLSANSYFTDRLETVTSLATNKAEFGAGVFTVGQDLLLLDFSARYQLLKDKLTVRAGTNITNSTSTGATTAPSFTRVGFRGGITLFILEDLKFLATAEMRSKSFDGGGDPINSFLASARLAYSF